jgi:hypothetical protein
MMPSVDDNQTTRLVPAAEIAVGDRVMSYRHGWATVGARADTGSLLTFSLGDGRFMVCIVTEMVTVAVPAGDPS